MVHVGATLLLAIHLEPVIAEHSTMYTDQEQYVGILTPILDFLYLMMHDNYIEQIT